MQTVNKILNKVWPNRRESQIYQSQLGIYMVENHITSKQQQWWIPLKSPVDSGKTFFYISVNTGQIGMGFEADTPEKMTPTCPTYATFRQRSG